MQSVPADATKEVSRPGESAAAEDLNDTRLYRLAEHASDPIALLDPEGRYLYLNPACAKLYATGTVLTGGDAFSHVFAEDRERMRRTFLDTLRSGEQRSAEFRLQDKDGTFRHFDCKFDAWQKPDTSVECVIAISRDITARRQMEAVLNARAAALLDVQDVAKLGGFDWDLKNNSIYWSPELRQIFGVDAAFKPTLESFGAMVHPDDREWVAQMAQRSMAAGTIFQSPYRIMRHDGSVRIVEAHAQLVRDEYGRPLRQFGALQDVTDRKWAGEQARTTEERFRTIVENVRDYAICLLDKAGNVTHWNLGAQRMFVYRNEEILEKHCSCMYLPEQVEQGEPALQLRIASGEGKFSGEAWRLRKGGSRFWAQITIMPLLDEFGGLRGYSMITHDITQRRRTEEDLRSYAERLRATSLRLVEIQETERRHIARELHDRVGQNLSAIGIDLSLIANGLPPDANPDLAARIEDSMALVEGTVDTMRNIMRELRPPTLDEYGLMSALRSLAAAFTTRTGIRTTVTGSDHRGQLPKSADLAMFRIAQEALNNVARHSQAGRVEITLEIEDARSTLAITDDGVGFDRSVVEGQTPASCWGLLIMRERAEAIGAQFNLNTTPGTGVQVFVEYRY
jgi:PAS domain S-box-containing protein